MCPLTCSPGPVLPGAVIEGGQSSCYPLLFHHPAPSSLFILELRTLASAHNPPFIPIFATVLEEEDPSPLPSYFNGLAPHSSGGGGTEVGGATLTLGTTYQPHKLTFRKLADSHSSTSKRQCPRGRRLWRWEWSHEQQRCAVFLAFQSRKYPRTHGIGGSSAPSSQLVSRWESGHRKQKTNSPLLCMGSCLPCISVTWFSGCCGQHLTQRTTTLGTEKPPRGKFATSSPSHPSDWQ